MKLSSELTVVAHKLLTAQIHFEKKETEEDYSADVNSLLDRSLYLLIEARKLLKRTGTIISSTSPQRLLLVK